MPMGTTENYVLALQKQIMETQQYTQALEQQIQACIQQPGPTAAQQMFHLQHQSATAQSSLQQLLMQYGQFMIAGSATANFTAPSTAAESSTHQVLLAGPLQPMSTPRIEENQTPLSTGAPSISAHIPQPLSYSQTLNEMGFEEVVLPPGPSLLAKKSAVVATSSQTIDKVPNAELGIFDQGTHVNEHVSGIVVSTTDAFSKMGNSKRPKMKRVKTPAPVNRSKVAEASALFDEDVHVNEHVSGIVTSKEECSETPAPTPAPTTVAPSVAAATVAEQPTTRAALLLLDNDARGCAEVPQNVDEDMSEYLGIDEPAPMNMPDGFDFIPKDKPEDLGHVEPHNVDKDLCGHLDVDQLVLRDRPDSPRHFKPTDMREESTQVPPQVAFEVGMAQLFLGLPAFEPTDMSLKDLNLDPEDLMPFPEDLRQMLQQHEPLVDNQGGRPSSQTLKIVDDELAELDKRLTQLSKTTGISVTSIMKRWNTTKSRGGSLWNTYQRYFTAHKEDELARLGLDPSIVITGKIRANAYVAFRNAFPTTWPEILEYWAEFKEVENPMKTVQQRSMQFRHIWRALCNLVCSLSLFRSL